MVIYSSTFPPLRANTPRVELFTPDPPLLEVPVPNEVALPVDANVTKSNLVYWFSPAQKTPRVLDPTPPEPHILPAAALPKSIALPVVSMFIY